MRQTLPVEPTADDTTLLLTNPSQSFAIVISGIDKEYIDELHQALYATLYMSARFLSSQINSDLPNIQLIRRTKAAFRKMTQLDHINPPWISYQTLPIQTTDPTHRRILDKTFGCTPFFIRKLVKKIVISPNRSSNNFYSSGTHNLNTFIDLSSHRFIELVKRNSQQVKIFRRARTRAGQPSNHHT